MKACFKCHAVKPLSEYYPHPRMTDGRLGKCKDCAKTDSEERRLKKAQDPVWAENERVRHLLKSRRYRGKEPSPRLTKEELFSRQRDARIRFRKQFPQKWKAHCLVNNAVRDGRLKKEPCFCGAKAQAHHEDYTRPLDVVWLCTKHHAERHVELRRIARLAKAVA